jgi:hypothetical protein
MCELMLLENRFINSKVYKCFKIYITTNLFSPFLLAVIIQLRII